MVLILYVVCLLLVQNVDGFHHGIGLFARPLKSTALGLTTSDFKPGITFEENGTVLKLLEFCHVKSARSAAFVKAKVKNMMSGAVQDRTFRSGESITAAEVRKVEMQFMYQEGADVTSGNSAGTGTGDGNYMFMNMVTFEEQAIEAYKIEQPLLLYPGLSVNVLEWNEQVLCVQLPQTIDVKVSETPPNFKGNTAQGGLKPATLEGGAVIQVPMFIEVGEMVRMDTTEMKYIARASK
jgi:elongation factor P